MFRIKYFEGIHQARIEQRPIAELSPFDIGRLRGRGGFADRIAGFFLDDPRWWLSLLRRYRPIAGIGRFLLVTRSDDVRDVLERGSEFETPYGPEMTELSGGSNFILGMQDGADYRRMKSAVLGAFPPDEVEARVRPLAARHSQDIMAGASPGFDAVADLLKIVPVRICRDFFGLRVEDEAEFAEWAMALSALFFSDPFASAATRELAVVAADRLIRTIDMSIEAVRDGRTCPDLPLSRMVAMMDRERVSLGEVHSIVLGMIAGFAPTNLLAGGNCLDVILAKPEARAAIEKAIAARDDARLDRAVLEAMRFKPIWIGPWRYAARDAVIARGTSRERLVRKGTVVMPATLSAMFDPDAVARPNEFDAARSPRDYLVYGHGIHLCIGAEIARVQIGECLRALFRQKGLRRAPGAAGRLRRIGAFPLSLRVDFERMPLCRVVEPAMATAICPVRRNAKAGDLRGRVAALGNPARPEVSAALDAASIIHFASLTLAETGEGENAVLVLELSGDGSAADVVDAFAAHAGPSVQPLFEEACQMPPGQALRDYLRAHMLDISPSFGSAAGLVFSGTPGHSVARIRAEAELAELARGIVEESPPGMPAGAASILAEVRAHVRETGRFDWALASAESLLERRGGSVRRAVATTLLAPRVLAGTAVVLLVGWWATYALVFGYAPGLLRNLFVVGTSLLLTLLGLAALGAAAFGASFLALRRLEKQDRPGSAAVELARLDQILEREDRTTQNHLTAMSTLKTGMLRKAALRLAFYLVSISARKVFRPGYLGSLDTIHFARWVVLPGSGRLLFLSNYGGSWESYLEDFIAKASAGLTGVWSNAEGFPRTRWLFLDGARDGDRFKRWARLQQMPTLFWYSAYPELDTRRIRINSLIRRGIASAAESEARDWLSLFGSRPRPRIGRMAEAAAPRLPPPAEQLEIGEIQSIFFTAFGSLEHGHMLAIAVPGGLSRAQRRAWLDVVAPLASFGDRIPRSRAMTIAFGPDGLRRLGLEGGLDEDPLDRFAVAFRHGMGNPSRSRILDDAGDSRPELWQWGSQANPVDIVLLCYAVCAEELEAQVAWLKDRTLAAGLTLAAELPLRVRREGKRAVEHFGFVDGVSQPVVRGTRRAHDGVAPMHLVAAGEFLFGYRDEHGFRPSSPTVKASHDPAGILPALPVARGSGGAGDSGVAPHDFGRNGSFLVVRQFEQHVDAFADYCARAADAGSEAFSERGVTPRWIAAKMLGRWQDGSSLVRNPEGRPGRPADNDFSFGAEDPQGHRCPLGAHVRRSNPRDSLGDDHDAQIRIGKRHRLLRVGRTYEKAAAGSAKPEKGLLFMCLNADIERQYEFVQQTWVAGASFHGLGEKDPTIGAADGHGRFSIPSFDGGMVLRGLPRFVTTRGGGYFFLPSRAALAYLRARL